MSRGLRALAIMGAMMLTSCASIHATNRDVNSPLAQVRFDTSEDYDALGPMIWSLSRSKNFAVQEIITRPRGQVDFTIRLYRDDLTLVISRLRGEAIQLAAYPLCSCQRGKRLGLQDAADASIKDLKEALSHR